VICKEELEEEPEKESPNKVKKKDPNKVDKKYLWPHGITPPCKNVRKRRFRKTLKKKNVDAPEIEKEVKRLLRVDNDAVRVDFEIINEDLEKRANGPEVKEDNQAHTKEIETTAEQSLDDSAEQKDDKQGSDVEDDSSKNIIPNIDEHDIFGEELSSSDDDEDRNDTNRSRELDESSRLSADDTRISTYSMGGAGTSNLDASQDNTFNKSMFNSPRREYDELGGSSSNLAAPSNYFSSEKRTFEDDDFSNEAPVSNQEIKSKIHDLEKALSDLQAQKIQKTQEYSQIQNATLRQRIQDILDNISRQIAEKSQEKLELENAYGVQNQSD